MTLDNTPGRLQHQEYIPASSESFTNLRRARLTRLYDSCYTKVLCRSELKCAEKLCLLVKNLNIEWSFASLIRVCQAPNNIIKLALKSSTSPLSNLRSSAPPCSIKRWSIGPNTNHTMDIMDGPIADLYLPGKTSNSWGRGDKQNVTHFSLTDGMQLYNRLYSSSYG